MRPSFATHLFIVLTALLLPSAAAWGQEKADLFHRTDKNQDGKLTREELPERVQPRFAEMDADGNGSVSAAEFDAWSKKRNDPQAAPRAKPARAALPPTHANVSYGDHQKQAFDIWLAKSKDGKPTPLVIYIHGGGFRGGDKSSASGEPVQNYLDAGISFASMNYRLSDVGPYPIMMHDAARGLQTIRAKAKEWNLDASRIACYGGSAGAGISLWLGFHDDLADPKSEDPIARQSTRIVAAGTQNGQSTYDMRTFREWFGVPNLAPHPALVTLYGVQKESDWETDRVKKLMTDASAITHLTKDDCPVFMTYGAGDVPVDEKSSPGLWVHHARLGIKLKEAMDKLGLECHVTWKDHPSEKYASIHAFLQEKVSGKPGTKNAEADSANR